METPLLTMTSSTRRIRPREVLPWALPVWRWRPCFCAGWLHDGNDGSTIHSTALQCTWPDSGHSLAEAAAAGASRARKMIVRTIDVYGSPNVYYALLRKHPSVASGSTRTARCHNCSFSLRGTGARCCKRAEQRRGPQHSRPVKHRHAQRHPAIAWPLDAGPHEAGGVD